MRLKLFQQFRDSRMKHHNHELLILLTFAALIMTGTAALHLPFVKHSGGLPFLDALFTATSATCVTGLITVPTSGFNLPGQIIILVLIQFGAIGIMTLSTSFILFFLGQLDLEKRIAVTRLSLSPTMGDVEGVLKTVIMYTFLFEAIGFLFLLIGFLGDGFSIREGMYHALFHTISAFCNAGFSTFDSSMQHVNPMIQLTIMILIVLGGLGYYFLFDTMEFIKKRDRLTLHTKVVFTATPICIIVGASVFKLVEQENITLLDSFFQSVTARTAGFNSLALTDLHTASLVVLIALMIIGAAPGSTGGGMKITTFCVVFLTTYNTIRGRETVAFFGRQLSQENILRAFAVAVVYLLFLFCSTIFLLHYEGREVMGTAFEMASAVGTVGLSLGLTPQLGPVGKVILIIGMFVGRICPAVLVLILIRPSKVSHVEYPSEKIILG